MRQNWSTLYASEIIHTHMGSNFLNELFLVARSSSLNFSRYVSMSPFILVLHLLKSAAIFNFDSPDLMDRIDLYFFSFQQAHKQISY